jgi:hypothetical protein
MASSYLTISELSNPFALSFFISSCLRAYCQA